MRTPKLVFSITTAMLLAGNSLVSADPLLPGAAYSTDVAVTGVAHQDYWIYEESPAGSGVLVQTDNALNLISVSQGFSPGNVGGNVELFVLSDTATYTESYAAGSAFATANSIHLTGTAGGLAFDFRSLNGQDWFFDGSSYNTTYGANNLATRWFNDFSAYLATAGSPLGAIFSGNATVFNALAGSGMFQTLSDPNIDYVYALNNQLFFGLGDFLNETPRLKDLMTAAGYGSFTGLLPDGLQYSEVVILNGEVYYSFGSAVPSGVLLSDGSYDATTPFATPVPEPGSILLVALGLSIRLMKRQRLVAA